METILLTKQNAHRVAMVRRKDNPASTPVPFRWRGERRFGIGYNKAGKIMDQMEAAGIVGPAQGAKPRAVLMDPTTLETLLQN